MGLQLLGCLLPFQVFHLPPCFSSLLPLQPFSILLSFLNAQKTQMTLPFLSHPRTFQILVSLCFISGTHLGKDRLSIIICAAPSQLPRWNLLLQHNSLILFSPEHLLLAAFGDRTLHWSGIAIPISAQKKSFLKSLRVNGKWNTQHLPRIWDQNQNELRKSKKSLKSLNPFPLALTAAHPDSPFASNSGSDIWLLYNL